MGKYFFVKKGPTTITLPETKHITSEDILNAKLEDRWQLSGMSKEAFEVICEAMEDYVLHVLKTSQK